MAPSTHPPCSICRDGTYATMSLRTLPGEYCEWTHYCDVCGDEMTSVVREGQKREPEKKTLPPPPTTNPPEPKLEKAKERGKRPPPPSPSDTAPSPSPKAKPSPSLKEAMRGEGYDLLALLGMKR
jgi:hypothetical protein